jgi:hypothetical protein
MPPIEAWQEEIAHSSIGGSINTASAFHGPMCLGLHHRCPYPGWHRHRGIAFRRAEFGTAARDRPVKPTSLRGLGRALTGSHS